MSSCYVSSSVCVLGDFSRLLPWICAALHSFSIVEYTPDLGNINASGMPETVTIGIIRIAIPIQVKAHYATLYKSSTETSFNSTTGQKDVLIEHVAYTD